MKTGEAIDMNGYPNPDFTPDNNGTNTPGQSNNDNIIDNTQDIITNANTDKNDIAGSSFAKFRLKATGKNKAVKLSWKEIKGSEGYTIYGAKNGKKMKKIKDMPSGVKSYTVKKLAKGTYYKFIIVSYRYSQGKKYTIATSSAVHCVTNGGKFGNPQKLVFNKKKLNVKVGKKIKLKPKYKSDKKVKIFIAKFRYESSNSSVAKVDKKGRMTGVKKGKCYVYIYTQNGLYKRVRVSVR